LERKWGKVDVPLDSNRTAKRLREIPAINSNPKNVINGTSICQLFGLSRAYKAVIRAPAGYNGKI